MYDSLILYEDEDIRFTGEVIHKDFYIHVSVFNYSKSVKKKIAEIWNVISEEVFLAGWDYILSYNTNVKFAKMFGFEYFKSIQYEDVEYEVYKWELKPQQLLLCQ